MGQLLAELYNWCVQASMQHLNHVRWWKIPQTGKLSVSCFLDITTYHVYSTCQWRWCPWWRLMKQSTVTYSNFSSWMCLLFLWFLFYYLIRSFSHVSRDTFVFSDVRQPVGRNCSISTSQPGWEKVAEILYSLFRLKAACCSMRYFPPFDDLYAANWSFSLI